MSFLKDIKPETKRTLIICLTVIAVALIMGAAYSGTFDTLLDELFKAAKK